MRVGDGEARRLKTRACRDLAEATLTTTHPDLFARPGEARGLRLAAISRAHDALWRRLLRLLPARRRLCRPRRGSRAKAVRCRRADPDHRGSGRCDHHMGGEPAIDRRPHRRRGRSQGSTSKPSAYCSEVRLEVRPPLDPQIGIERRPEQSHGLVGLLQDLVARLRNQTCVPTFSRNANSSMAASRRWCPSPAANSSSGTATLKG